MRILESHVSPDGLLKLIVVESEDGDISIGFDGEGFPWHTHADIEAELSGLPEAKAVRQFVDSILNDQAVLVVESKAGKIIGVWPTDDIADEIAGAAKYGAPDEMLEFRVWSGRRVQ